MDLRYISRLDEQRKSVLLPCTGYSNLKTQSKPWCMFFPPSHRQIVASKRPVGIYPGSKALGRLRVSVLSVIVSSLGFIDTRSALHLCILLRPPSSRSPPARPPPSGLLLLQDHDYNTRPCTEHIGTSHAIRSSGRHNAKARRDDHTRKRDLLFGGG